MKIMKKLNLIYLFAGLLFLVSSCEDDLNTVPLDDDASTAEDFFSQDNAYKSLLAGVYGNLSLTSAGGAFGSNIGGLDPGTSQYGRALMNLQTFTTDEAIWSYENDPGIAELQRTTWTPANVIIRGAFGRIMGSVAFANEFLRQSTEAKLNSRDISGEELQEMPTFRAEARLLRALSYYHMLDLFGKAHFITEEDPVGVFRNEEIVGVDLFNYIESELLEIIPDLKDARTNEYARADKAVAWMILAKLYLNAEVYIGEDRYADALEYSQNIIDAGYSLTPNYQDVFRGDNDVNGAQNEVIFPVPADGEFSQSFGPTTVMTNGAVGSIEQNGANLGVTEGGWGGAIRLSPQFVSLFQGAEFTNDARNGIISEDRPINITDVSNRDQGYILEKFTDLNTSDDPVDDNLTFSSVDFPMFRLADVYLMYAEAHLRGGGGSLTQATEYINLIRTRAHNGSTTWNISESDLTLDFIIDERARELYWESHRRQDLRRFGLFTGASYVWTLKGNSLSGIPIADYRGLFPIPSESLSANPNLTQNPGY
ncbi:RagB/SusD family nutrient uptake outer membrane protein [Mesohalobacter halotolerans]|uniref:RagB/SusD family nutrient uptake outer membrane protein n=2 Tax=Mesohalobacter halotolerans TaxID=1883405 RepID=A0A4U5TRI9_9FLAO|nr:RagB/SusD family nutrient uptake outer membrane protein [Mesohalobacter halotolerans]